MRYFQLLILIILFIYPTGYKATDLGDENCSSLLLVSNWSTNNVKIYDGCSGEYIRDLDSQNLIDGPLGILEAPNGDVLVISERNSRMISFDRNTLSTGTVILGDNPATTEIERNFISAPSGAIIGDDGFMYAASYVSNKVVKIDINNWQTVDQILAPNNGLIDGIDAGIKITSDGHLLLPGFESSNILKVNLTTKATSTLVAASEGGLLTPRTLLIREQSNELWVTDERGGAVMVFNLTTGKFIKKLIEETLPTGMMKDGDNHFLVNTHSAVIRVANDGKSSVKIVQDGAGNLTLGTFVYRLQKISIDDDGDGLSNEDETNLYLTDPDNSDTDGDTLSDGDEINIHGSDPLLADSDADGMPDDYEVSHALEVLIDDSAQDLDNDGLTNLDEFLAGTLVNNDDTDGDGEKDGVDVDPLIPNSAPEISGAPETSIEQDSLYSFTPVIAYAGNLATVSVSIANKPEWITFNQDTAELSGTPVNDDVGNYENIILTASNGYYNVELPGFSIDVININDAPIIVSNISNKTYTIGDTVSLDISANFDDIDIGDSLIVSATELPVGVTITNEGLISGSPSVVATYNVKVTVTDSNGATANTTFIINIQDEDKPTTDGGGGGSSHGLLMLLLIAMLLGNRGSNFIMRNRT